MPPATFVVPSVPSESMDRHTQPGAFFPEMA